MKTRLFLAVIFGVLGCANECWGMLASSCTNGFRLGAFENCFARFFAVSPRNIQTSEGDVVDRVRVEIEKMQKTILIDSDKNGGVFATRGHVSSNDMVLSESSIMSAIRTFGFNRLKVIAENADLASADKIVSFITQYFPGYGGVFDKKTFVNSSDRLLEDLREITDKGRLL
jgi:hypothetical protein